MRCSAIASALRERGVDVRFLVSDENSRAFLGSAGVESIVMFGDCMNLGAEDGIRIASIVTARDVVVVDSYAVSEPFFAAMASCGLRVVYLDDAYTFTDGCLEIPKPWPVLGVVNYGFAFEEKDYRFVYGSRSPATFLLIGPRYAIVAPLFSSLAGTACISYPVLNVMVTSGSTNPHHSLERMVAGCRAALPQARITVVVGRAATFEDSAFNDDNLVLLHDVVDMAHLMLENDLVVSAAGTTLYELCTLGVPSAAVPIVDNQLINIGGFEKLALGSVIKNLNWQPDDIRRAVVELTVSQESLKRVHDSMRDCIKGDGAQLVADALIAVAKRGFGKAIAGGSRPSVQSSKCGLSEISVDVKPRTIRPT